jgi:putative addiction module killer protein
MYLLSDNPVCSDFEKPRNFPVGLNHCETLERALKSCAVYPVQQREISATLSPWGEGISEMRVDIGAGYRVYYARAGRVVYVLLCGGDKGSQAGDIAHAKRLWTQIKRSTDHDEIP